MSFPQIPYHNTSPGRKYPLLIGCSGGGGHNSGIQGIHGFLEAEYPDTVFPKYTPVLHTDKSACSARTQIETGAALMHLKGVSAPVRGFFGLTPFPVLPNREDLDAEVESLNAKEAKNGQRSYVDMLLDVYPAGYESAAIWNVLQRADKVSDLRKLISFQQKSDADNYEIVHAHYLDLLKQAVKNGTPYTEIISTQAMALPALCDAAKDYNDWLDQEQNAEAARVVIHQYMTDLPTKGAIHFFNPLSSLTPQQQQQMKLYAVEITENIMKHFFPEGCHFQGVFDVPAKQNPMVRPGFKDPSLDNSKKFNEDVTLTLAGNESCTIIAHEQIASIMLGSQGGNDTFEYVQPLLKKGTEKVFIFGGKNKDISHKIDNLIANDSTLKDKIIRLDNQSDKESAPLMTRSNTVIIRGGGLSVMEQKAMAHNEDQSIFIHHANSHEEDLTSGISWEDGNVRKLLKDLLQQNVYSQKTSPDRASQQFAEARIIATIKKSAKSLHQDDALRYIKKLSTEQLDSFIREIKQTDKQILPQELINHMKDCESQQKQIISELQDKCMACKEHLIRIIEKKCRNLKVLVVI